MASQVTVKAICLNTFSFIFLGAATCDSFSFALVPTMSVESFSPCPVSADTRSVAEARSSCTCRIVRIVSLGSNKHEPRPCSHVQIENMASTSSSLGNPPWLLQVGAIRCIGASLSAGGCRSASLSFFSAVQYQLRGLGEPIVTRGLGPSSLKDIFLLQALDMIKPGATDAPFNMDNLLHFRDVMVIGSFFMLRDVDFQLPSRSTSVWMDIASPSPFLCARQTPRVRLTTDPWPVRARPRL